MYYILDFYMMYYILDFYKTLTTPSVVKFSSL